MFLRNIYEPKELEMSENIKNIENFYTSFNCFIQASISLNEFYTRDNDIEYIEHQCVENVMNKYLDFLNSFE